jgi:hypothetical protein
MEGNVCGLIWGSIPKIFLQELRKNLEKTQPTYLVGNFVGTHHINGDLSGYLLQGIEAT